MNPEEKIDALSKRLDDIEARQAESKRRQKIDLAEASFKTVLDADYHLDDKASRILSAMAFLTAAAAAIFAKAYSSGTPGAPRILVFGVDLSLVAFLAYMVFVLIGAGLFLAALGPALNKPSGWLISGASDVRSRLFYDFIARVHSDAWSQYWNSLTAEELQNRIQQDYVFESRLLAEKARAKFLSMSFGSVFFRLALIWLIILVASLFSSNATIVQFISIFGSMALLVVFAFERLTQPPRPQKDQILDSWLLWLITLIIFLFVGLVLTLISARGMTFGLLTIAWGVMMSSYSAYRSALRNSFNDERWGVSFILLAIALYFLGVLLTFYSA
jgi:hypothetical protein